MDFQSKVKNRVLSAQSREIIYTVIKFMREEATKGALILPLAAVNERVKAATGVSLRTISRISLEGKNVEQGGVASFSTPNDKRPNRKSPKALNDSERANLRRVIENLRSTEKTVPSLRSIHKQFCHEYNYQGCVETLRKEVNRIGFRWNKGSKECTVEKEVHSNNSEDSLPNYTDCETEHVESADYIHYEDIKTEIIKNEHSENESYVCEMCYECFDNETGLIHHKIDGFCCKEKNQIEFKFQPMDNELTDSGTSTTYIKDELNSSSMENYKFCLVPRCYSSSDQHPDKIFVSLPNATSKLRKRRKSWLLAIGRDENDISNEYGGFVCEDHFNLEEDMVNYVKYKVMGGNILLKNDVVPHIFDCWEDTK